MLGVHKSSIGVLNCTRNPTLPKKRRGCWGGGGGGRQIHDYTIVSVWQDGNKWNKSFMG